MRNLRRHELDASSNIRIHLAADARMSRTNYSDDQVWSVELGAGDRAALAYQTRFGGRAGLVSLVPIWQAGDQRVYQQASYQRPPIMTHFAPNLLRVSAEIVSQLQLEARFWVMESQAAGAEFFLVNGGDETLVVQLELFGHVALNDRNRKLNVLTLADHSLALHLGQIGNLNPVTTLEGASFDIYGGRISSPKLGLRFSLESGGSRRIPFVTAGLPDTRNSHSIALNWMSRPWEPYFDQIERNAASVPAISTGNAEWDRLLDLSQSLALKSIMRGADNLPHPSYVANRTSSRGWSRRGDGSDHIRAWAGQDPTLAYLIVAWLANIDSDLACGIVRNYLSTQDDSGYVDRQPGMAGQRQGLLMMPILARMAWQVVERTEERRFHHRSLAKARAIFLSVGCRKIMTRMAMASRNGDRSGNWGMSRCRPLGLVKAGRKEADIRQMETPDLLAYLISEAGALCDLAQVAGDQSTYDKMRGHRDRLLEHLNTFWNGSRYIYRDRDSHHSCAPVELLYGGAGDQLHKIERGLDPANRVVVRIVGGVSQRPRIQLRLLGENAVGDRCSF